MSNNPFAAPAAASGMDWAGHLGRLLLVEPHSHEQGIQTSLGTKDAVRATITVLDGDTAGTVLEDVLVFPKVLIGQLRPKIGEKVLGRLGQGEAKPGQNAPWKLAEAGPADVQVGMAWLNRVTPPAAAAAPAAAEVPPFMQGTTVPM